VKVLVLGAGVVGTAASWYLAREGYEVEVIDRQPGPGLETSFANGGQVSASHATPWASPRTPLKALRWMGRKDAPLVFKWWRWDPALWRWGLQFLANCSAARTARHTERAVRIALYSRESLKELRAATGISYDHKSRGILHIFRDPKEFEDQCRWAEVMHRAGLPQHIMRPEELVQTEPALRSAAHELIGGIFSPDDESGDAHRFTCEMHRLAEAEGVIFRLNETITELEHKGSRITGVRTRSGRHTADTYVLSLGSWSPFLARQVGLRLPIYPAKGYSITLPLDGDPPGAPNVSITDDEHKMVYSRLGNRLRAAGTAELAGWDLTLNPERAAVIRRNAQNLFPEAGDYAKAEPWCGLRPKTPDSVPYVCATPVSNLFLNTGHGTLGWTMSVGSARLLTDLIAGRTPDIDTTGYGLER